VPKRKERLEDSWQDVAQELPSMEQKSTSAQISFYPR
jgi:hypothetical protein